MTDRSRWSTVAAIASLAALLLALVATLLTPARAQGGARFELITPAEQRSDQAAAAANPEVRTRSLPVPRTAPSIVVLAPSLSSSVAAPLRLELAFKPLPGTRIVPSSFRVLYGVLKIDLTERMLRHGALSENGLVVEQAQVPDGLHRLFMQISDDKGNQAEQEVRLRVGAQS